MIRDVGVQPLFHGSGSQSQGLSPGCHLQRFKIQIGNGLTT
jgi:hypothetical protein